MNSDEKTPDIGLDESQTRGTSNIVTSRQGNTSPTSDNDWGDELDYLEPEKAVLETKSPRQTPSQVEAPPLQSDASDTRKVGGAVLLTAHNPSRNRVGTESRRNSMDIARMRRRISVGDEEGEDYSSLPRGRSSSLGHDRRNSFASYRRKRSRSRSGSIQLLSGRSGDRSSSEIRYRSVRKSNLFALHQEPKELNVVFRSQSSPSDCFEGLSIRESVRILHQEGPYGILELFFMILTFVAISYYAIAIPFRLGFYFDGGRPGDASHRSIPVEAFKIFSGLDYIADFCCFYSFGRNVLRALRKFSKRKSKAPSRIAPSGGSSAPLSGSSYVRTASARKLHRAISSNRHLGMSSGTAKGVSFVETVLVKHWNRVQWICECIAIIPWEFFLSGSPQLAAIARLPKLLRLHRLSISLGFAKNSLTYMISKHTFMVTGIFRSVALSLGLLYCCHICACGFMMIAKLECGWNFDYCSDSRNFADTCWALKDQLQDQSIVRQYSRSMYWAVVTLITVGYGDIVPVTQIETLFVAVVEITGALLCTALIASFAKLFQVLNKRHSDFSALQDQVGRYMRSRRIPDHLKTKVLDYLNYVWSFRKGVNEEQVLADLPEHFRSRCMNELKSKLVVNVPYIANEPLGFVNRVAALLEVRYYSPQDVILSANDAVVQEMFFISHGKVGIIDRSLSTLGDTHLGYLNTGQHLAAIAMFRRFQFPYLAVAEVYCELYCLSIRSFNAAINHHFQDDSDFAWKRMEDIALDKCPSHVDHTSLSGTLGQHQMSTKIRWSFPKSDFRNRWNAFGFIALLYLVVTLPYNWFFGQISNTSLFGSSSLYLTHCIVTGLIDIFFMCDIYLRAQWFAYLGCVLEGLYTPIENPTLIFQNYKDTGEFALDTLTTIPFDTIGSLIIFSAGYNTRAVTYVRAVGAIRFLRVRQVGRLFEGFSSAFYLSTWSRAMIKFVICVVLLLHGFGCLFYGVGHQTSQSSQQHLMSVNDGKFEVCLRGGASGDCSWTVYDDLYSEAYSFTMYHYVRSIYWAIVCFTTVGYGDIRPFTTAESLMAFLCVYVGGILNYSVVGLVSSVITSMTSTKQKHHDQLSYISRYLALHNVSIEIRRTIRNYFLYQWSRRKGVNEAELLNSLPLQLRSQVCEVMNMARISHIPIFDRCKQSFMVMLCTKLTEQVFQRDDYIVRSGTIADSLFFINRGQVEVRIPRQRHPLLALESGTYFGEIAFLTNAYHKVDITAASFCDISALSKQDFDSIILQFPDELGTIHEEAKRMSKHYAKLNAALLSNIQRPKIRASMRTTFTFYPDIPLEKWIIRPTSQSYLAWIALVVFTLNYNALVIIFRLAHLRRPTPTTLSYLTYFDILLDIIYALDIYFHAYHFGFIRDGEEENHSTDIFEHYVNSRVFKIDAISMLPFYYWDLNRPMLMHALRLPRLIKCFRLPGLIRFLERQYEETHCSAKTRSAVSLFNLVIMICYAGHLASCGFMLFMHAEGKVDVLLLDNMDRNTYMFNVVQYVRSFYWGLGTLTLVCYGDIVPHGLVPTFFTFFVCLCAFFIIGQIIGQFSEMILRLDQDAFVFQQCKDRFEQYANTHDLPASLQDRVKAYLRFQFESSKGLETSVIMDSLSPTLKLVLSMAMYEKLFIYERLFDCVDVGRLHAMASHLTMQIFLPNDNIITKNLVGRQFYIMRSGCAEVRVAALGNVVASIPEGKLFGELAFFLPSQPRTAYVCAVGFCEVMVMDRTHWNRIFVGTHGKTLMKEMQAIAARNLQLYRIAQHNILKNFRDSMKGSQRRSKLNRMMNDTRTRSRSSLPSTKPRPHAHGRTDSTMVKNMFKTSLAQQFGDVPTFRSIGRRSVSSLQSFAESRRGSTKYVAPTDEFAIPVMPRPRSDSILAITSDAGDPEDMQPYTSTSRSSASSSDSSDEAVAEVGPRFASEARISPRLSLSRDQYQAREQNSITLDSGNLEDFVDQTLTPERVDQMEYMEKEEADEEFIFQQQLDENTKQQDPQSEIVVIHRSIWIHRVAPPEFTLPFSHFRQYWNVLLLGISIYHCIVIPLRACLLNGRMVTFAFKEQWKTARTKCPGHEPPVSFLYNSTPMSLTTLTIWFGVEYIIDIILVLDIWFHWHHFTYYHRGELVHDRENIRNRYSKQLSFFIDILAICPTDLIAYGRYIYFYYVAQCLPTASLWQDLEFSRSNRLLRIIHFSSLFATLEQTLLHYRKWPISTSTFRFVQMIFQFLLISHWIGCFWFAVGKFTFPSSGAVDAMHNGLSWVNISTYNQSWIIYDHLLEPDMGLTMQYVRSVYFAFTSVTTVGYGDIASVNLIETFAQIVIIFLSVSLFGSLVASQEMRIQRVDGPKEDFEQRIQQVRDFLAYRNIPVEIRNQINLYFLALWQTKGGLHDEVVLQSYPSTLRRDIAMHVKREILAYVRLFDSCEVEFVRSIIEVLKEEVFLPNVMIVQQGDIGRSMYFIKSGTVEVADNAHTFCVTKETGDYFGEVSLLYDMPRSANCIARTICQIFVLDHGLYCRVLRDFPEYRDRNRNEWVLKNKTMIESNEGMQDQIDRMSKSKQQTLKNAARMVAKAANLGRWKALFLPPAAAKQVDAQIAEEEE